MGEIIPRECITNALYEDNHLRVLSSLELSWEWHILEVMLQVFVEGYTVEASAPVVELIREKEGY